MAEGAIPFPPAAETTVRCFGCRNRVGLAGVVVLESGALCCRRCWDRREVLSFAGIQAYVEVIG